MRPAVICAILLAAARTGWAAPAYDEVAPLFNSRCVLCHAGPQAPNGLALDSHASILKGGKNGPVVRPGDARASELVKRIRGENQPRMPMTGPPYLTDAEIALIESWIQAGAIEGTPGASPAPAKPSRKPGDPVTYADVETILLGRCVKCHAENGAMGPPPEGYILRTYEQTLSAAGRARIVPGKPFASELLRRIRGLSQPRMPFDGPPWLTDEETALVEQWIALGARDKAGKPAPVPVGAAVRFRGTLTAPNQMDGLTFRADGVRLDRAPRVGGAAELRGVVESDGTISATRLRGR